MEESSERLGSWEAVENTRRGRCHGAEGREGTGAWQGRRGERECARKTEDSSYSKMKNDGEGISSEEITGNKKRYTIERVCVQ